MKKFICLALAGVLSLAGCNSASNEAATPTEESKEPTMEVAEDAASYMVGVGASEHNKVEDFKDADHPGKLSLSTTVATVAVDSNDIIQFVQLDTFKADKKFDDKGMLDEDVAETNDLKSKKELGDDYGMRAASEIGKEWYEQAEAFEQFAVGKNINDLLEGKLSEDEDLKASCTMNVDGFVYALMAAYHTAQPFDGSLDSLKLVVEPTFSAKSADGDTNGTMSLYVSYKVEANGEDVAAGSHDGFAEFTSKGTVLELAE